VSETALTAAVLNALERVPGVVAWRCNSGTVKVRGAWMHLAPRGTADVIGFVVPNGRFFGIELKVQGGKHPHTKEQQEWGEKVVKHGGIYILARSVGEALDALTREMCIL
jgi:hypothetical protein